MILAFLRRLTDVIFRCSRVGCHNLKCFTNGEHECDILILWSNPEVSKPEDLLCTYESCPKRKGTA